MPTSGFINSFSQTIPFYADKPYIGIKSNIVFIMLSTKILLGQLSFILTQINGLNDENVRLSKKKNTKFKKTSWI